MASDCDHQWNWVKDIRFCLKCRQVRTFSGKGEASRVVWQGADDKRDPLTLPPEDKMKLARLGQLLGVVKAADCINIPMKVLRAWCGAYLRQPKAQDKPQSVSQDEAHDAPKSLSTPKSPLSTKVNNSDFGFTENPDEERKLDIVTDCLKSHKYEDEARVAKRVIALVRLLDTWHYDHLRYKGIFPGKPTKSTNC